MVFFLKILNYIQKYTTYTNKQANGMQKIKHNNQTGKKSNILETKGKIFSTFAVETRLRTVLIAFFSINFITIAFISTELFPNKI